MPGYLDHASSEPLAPEAREVLLAALDTGWADPDRLHSPARQARLLLDNARAAVAEALEVRPDEVSFTSSGTQAVHLGLVGLLMARRRTSRRLLATAVEHSAVFSAGRWWEEREAPDGAVTTVDVGPTGAVRLDRLESALGTPCGVLAVQQTNPEVATLQPLAQVADLADRYGVPLFVDACASAGLLPMPPGWDAAAYSAHKWGGPAGAGVLVVRKGSRWRLPFPGDERPDHRVSGFENVPATLAAAAALQARVAQRTPLLQRYVSLGRRLVAALGTIEDVDVHGPPVGSPDRAPQVLSCSFLYVDGETLVHELDRRGLRVASGSACTASALEPSHVLAAMGALTHGNIRVSFGPDTTEDDVDALAAALHEIVPRLRRELT